MKNSRCFAGYAAVMATGLVLAGCSDWSYQPPISGNPTTYPVNLPAVRAAVPQSAGTFGQALTGEYANLASALSQQNDYVDSDYFSRKGLAAAHSAVVPPENNANWLIPLEVPEHFRTDLAAQRTRLLGALDGGGRDRFPALAATAQTRYDCWVERMEDDWKTAINGTCHREFLTAMDELDKAMHPQAVQPPAAAQPGPTAPLREYRVYFDFDRAELLPDARQILQQVSDQLKRDGSVRITLVGHADRTGTDKYNLALSQRRADAVRNALVSDGVPRDRIEERWVGEREPPVPTPDGVREPRNRVVEITLR